VTVFGSFGNSTRKRVLDLLEPGDLTLGQVVIKTAKYLVVELISTLYCTYCAAAYALWSCMATSCGQRISLISFHYMIPQTFTVTSEHIRFYFLVFLFYTF